MEHQLKQIIEYYGVMKQLKYIHSEYFELDEAIISNEILKNEPIADKKYLKKHIAEEIADVMVMLEQFRLHYDIDEEMIKDFMEYKASRQIERIDEESTKNDLV